MTGFVYRLRGGTAAAVAAANPTLAKREPVVEWDTGRIKIGDGIHPWAELPYVGGEPPADELPDQTGNEGRILGTDGADPSWIEPPSGVVYQPEPPADPSVGQLWVDSDAAVADVVLPLPAEDGGVPAGGATDTHLVKTADADYATGWTDDGKFATLTVNEPGDPAGDLRAESDTEPDMLLLDASDDALWLGGSTNGLKISKGGRLRAYGTATWWDDLRVEPTVRGSETKAPAYTAIQGGLYAYAFDDAVEVSEKEVNFKLQMPHGWVQNSPIKLHLHWTPGTTGSAGQKVRWGCEYTYAAINSALPANTTIYAADPANPPSTTPTALTHYLTAFAGITTSGTGLSTVLLGRLFRNSSHADDTFGGAAYLLGIDAHIEMAQLGSNDEFAD